MDSGYLDGWETLADGWRGADYEFVDQALQTAFRGLQRRATELTFLVGRYLYGDDRNPTVITPLTDMDRRGGISEQTMQRIAELNRKAAELLQSLDHFIRLAREKLNHQGPA